MEAMRRLFDGKSRLFIHTDQAKSIASAIHSLQEFHIPMVIVGGREADLVAPLLKASAVPVIIGPTHEVPSREDSPIDEAFTLPKRLFDAGVLFCFSRDGFWQQRTLPHQAGQAVGFGLPYEVAIAALTKNTAQILGLGKRTGTLEVGKDANIILSEGDALDMRGNRIRYAFIQGRQIDLDNKQKQLYRKYSDKYGHSLD
jgi:imidazolonepropionase-like amidohydrolase